MYKVFLTVDSVSKHCEVL